jgi:hypothetical protein
MVRRSSRVSNTIACLLHTVLLLCAAATADYSITMSSSTATTTATTTATPLLRPLDLEGSFYMPDDDDDVYETQRTQQMYAGNAWNRRRSSPVAIAVVAGPADVQKCLAWAANTNNNSNNNSNNKIQVSVRSGGHNWFGSSLQEDTLLIDTSRLDTCHIDAVSKTATVGPCLSGQRLNEEAAAVGLCFSTGHCPGVALGGYLLGGGFGWFADYFGMAVESVLGCTIVTGDGSILQVTDETHADWMWLVRGAGAAFPGVVTSFTLQLHALPPIIKSRTSIHPIEDYETIVHHLQQLRCGDESISTKVESSVILACTPPPLIELLGGGGGVQKDKDAPPPTKVCLIAFSVVADTQEEYREAVSIMEGIPSTPLLPYEEPRDHTFASLCETLRPAFPEAHRWMVTSHLLDIHKTTAAAGTCTDWAQGVRAAFQHKAPAAGYSSTLTVVGHCHSTAAKDGAYGPVPSPGIFIGTYGVYQQDDDDELAALRDYAVSSNVVTEQHDAFVKYNVLEHQLNRETAPKIFVGPTGVKLAALRVKLDPGHVFFDPTQADPW